MLNVDTHMRLPESVRMRSGPAARNVPAIVPVLLSLSKSMRALHGLKLAAVGFHNGQDEHLMAVPDEGIAVNELAELLMVRPSTVSKMTDRLLEKGLVERVGDPRDARRTILKLTEKGVRAREAVTAARYALEDELSKPLDEDTLASIQSTLDDCAERLEKRLKRLR